MAKLYFRYGAMGSSKTANALMVAFNYNEKGRRALLLKSAIDTRDGDGLLESRIGLSSPCKHIDDYIDENGSIISPDFSLYNCVIVDEAQFMTEYQVSALCNIVDTLDIPVICYGLRTDFQGKLFPGSAALLAMADKIEETKTLCWCGAKATHNARYDGNGIVREGNQVMIGGNDRYVGLCRKHHTSGDLS